MLRSVIQWTAGGTGRGVGIVTLAAELVGGREGPIGLTVHGLPKDNDRHFVWVNESIKSAVEVTFNILEDYLADPEPPKLHGRNRTSCFGSYRFFTLGACVSSR